MTGLVVFTLSTAQERITPAKPAPPRVDQNDTRLAFNPTACTGGDKRYVYWAVQQQVFRFRFKPDEPLYPRGGVPKLGQVPSAEEEVLIAPTPTEPEGCYGNPLRAGVAPYMQAFSEETFAKIFGRKMDLRTTGGQSFGAVSDRLRGFNAGESSKRLFLRSKDCWQRAPHFEECLVSGGTNRQDYYINRVFRIDAALLSKHLEVKDLYFSFYSDPAAGNPANGFATDSGFELFGNVALNNSFRIFPSEIDFLVPYHRALINYILDAHITGYRWAPNISK